MDACAEFGGGSETAGANVSPTAITRRAAILKKNTYGPNNQHFTSSSLLIVFNRVFSICVGLVILAYKVSRGEG